MAGPDAIDVGQESPSDIISYKTPDGKNILLSREAMTTYGSQYIDYIAKSSGKDNLVLADKHVYAHAKEQFPQSSSPIIDMYPDYLVDANDITAEVSKHDLDSSDYVGDDTNSILDSNIHLHIATNSPGTVAQPHGNSAMIILPSPSELKSDSFRNKSLSGLSGLDEKYLTGIPGSSMDWAKYLISHEVSHIAQKDAENTFYRTFDKPEFQHWDEGNPLTSENTKHEIVADISARRAFNAVSGTPPSMPQTMADLRIIMGFTNAQTMMEYRTGEMDEHYTGNALQDIEEGRKPDMNTDRSQFAVAYTNTLVGGFIAAKDSERIRGDKLKNNQESGAFVERDLEILHEELQKGGSLIPSNRGMNDGQEDPRLLYAATKVLLENGEFDDSPSAKQNAERFLKAIERSAPGIIDNQIVEGYRQAYKDPAMQNSLQSLHQYNRPERPPGYAHNEPKSDIIPAVSAPAPVPAPAV